MKNNGQLTALQIRQRLLEQNAHFVADNEHKFSEIRKATAINGQQPYAVIITCSDSRVVPEYIFSETIGSLVVIRTIGNVVGDIELKSLEYALQLFDIKMVMVMGHTGCRAVASAICGNMDCITSEINAGINSETDQLEAEKKNALHTLERIKKDTRFHEFLAREDFILCCSLYDSYSGVVEILD